MKNRKTNILQVTSLCHVTFNKRGVRLYSTINGNLLTFFNVTSYGNLQETIKAAKKTAYIRYNH